MRTSHRAFVICTVLLMPLGLGSAARAVSVNWAAQTPDAKGKAEGVNRLVELLQAAFIAKNPSVTQARVLELRSLGMGAGPYVLLGWGIRPDFKFEGRLDDELFGVFIVYNNLGKIERTLDVFPTQRWADYIVSFEKVTNSEVVVVGAGSYGDQKLRRIYDLSKTQ
jgi:hypothetical protein